MTRAPGHLPSLNALRAFEVSSRHLNFRAAAEELGVTQGAVAQHIRGLETELDLKLFERYPRSLTLTENGRAYAVSVRRAFELLTEATQALQPSSPHLTISVTHSFAAKWLIPRLPDFTTKYPEIDLRISATDRLIHFQTDTVDIAVRYGSPPFAAGLNTELLLDDILIAVASPELVRSLGPPDGGNNLAHYALLHDTHNAWQQFLEQARPGTPWSVAKSIRFSQTSLTIDAAVGGQGLALAHPAFVNSDITAGRLVRVFQTRLHRSSGFYIVFPRKLRHPESIAAVRTWLLEQATV